MGAGDRFITEDGTVRHGGAVVAVVQPIDVRFNDRGQLDPMGDHHATVEQLSVTDRAGFEAEMLASTRQALLNLAPERR